MTPLDPCRLAPVASINRVLLGPGQARDLLSADALRRLAGEAGLQPDGPVRSFLDRCLRAEDATTRRAAGSVAERFGERLGTLLATLRSGHRAARTEWDSSWWARWAGTTTVWVGGGLAAGRFGALVAGRADAVVGAGCRVVVPPDPGGLPLRGAARAARRPAGAALVLDFGHTLVKRAVAEYDGGEVTAFRRLAPAPAPDAAAAGTALGGSVAGTLAAAWIEAGRPSGPVVAAIAAYVPDGQPVRTQLGTYARLADLGDDVTGWLSARVGARTGTAVPVVLLHDGTAAALAVPPDPHAVVVLLGTSLGVGYPHRCPAPAPAPAPGRARRLSPGGGRSPGSAR